MSVCQEEMFSSRIMNYLNIFHRLYTLHSDLSPTLAELHSLHAADAGHGDGSFTALTLNPRWTNKTCSRAVERLTATHARSHTYTCKHATRTHYIVAVRKDRHRNCFGHAAYQNTKLNALCMCCCGSAVN